MKLVHRGMRFGMVGAAMAAITGGLVLTSGNTVGAAPPSAKTPIQHVVVIFQENESFDHYFATYPVASNPTGENLFTALPGTPIR